VDSVHLALRMQYRGGERITELPLTQDMIRCLAFEAQFRGMSMGKLVGELIIAMIKEDLFQQVLKQNSNQ
jgi:methyl coenzyme M reductase gamma subunit